MRDQDGRERVGLSLRPEIQGKVAWLDLGGGRAGANFVSDLKIVRILHVGLKSGQNTTFS